MARCLLEFSIAEHLRHKFPLLKGDGLRAIEEANPRLVLLVDMEGVLVFFLEAEEGMDWRKEMDKVYKSLCNGEKKPESLLQTLCLQNPHVAAVDDMLQDARTGKILIDNIVAVQAWKS
jgi:hypothetical protein